ncbi:PREDICTED: uncharacterized protein LOC108577723 [Habropoda laboriosa]|uniref:uncharacterized protein LOC108577723 n=1 Tax=Habropoda laboriosa TaxID=597456 RepID=UPI00083DC988|nr:PREDICTED: uncharacterized protein LOC108577723 [Habropoda laboriosa]
MTKGLIIFLIITKIHLNCGLNSNTNYQSRGHEFILHKCIASVQLNRKHRDEGTSNINSNKPVEYISFTMREKNSTSRELQPAPKYVNSEFNNNNSYTNYETDNNTGVKRFSTKGIENTPISTLNIKSMKSLLPIFTRKRLLPELENTTSKIRNSSRSVIVIKSY